jgi:hypothetical protein
MRSITPASGITISEYLASSEGNVFTSATLDATAVDTTDDDSKKYLDKGVLLAKINTPATASGLVGPWDPTESDGRQLTANIVGFNDTFADLSQGDVEVGVLIKGTVKEDQVVMGSADGDIPDHYKEYVRTDSLDIIFR